MGQLGLVMLVFAVTPVFGFEEGRLPGALGFEDEGRVVWFEGNYADYEADRRRRLGADAERPHRLRFKRLPRS